MASLDETKDVPTKGGPKDTDPSELVTMMGFAALDNGGLETIKAAMDTSQDPAQVVGQFLAQLTGSLAEFTQDQFGIDPAVFGQKDGFLDQMLDYIERKLGLPAEFSDQVYGDTLEVMKAAAMEGKGGGQPAGAPQPQAGSAPLDAPVPAAGGM